MSSWNYYNIGIEYESGKNDDKLIGDFMECLGYTELPDLGTIYIEGTGVEGPRWNFGNDGNKTTRAWKSDQYLGYIGFMEDMDLLYTRLSTLFEDISLYAVTARGNDTSDQYEGREVSINASTELKYSRSFDYCYGDQTAWGKEISEGDVSEIGTKVKEEKFSKMMFVDYTEIMVDCKNKGFNDLGDYIKYRLALNEEEELNRERISEELVVTGNSIKNREYFNCDKLVDVIIPSGTKSIGKEAFCCCDNLKSIEIPSSVEIVKEKAFQSCFNLNRLYVKNIIDYLKNSAKWDSHPFEEADGCNIYENGIIKTRGTLSISDEIVEIGKNAFRNCNGLKEVIISDSVQSIGASAFSGCNQMEKIKLSSGLKRIGYAAFCPCSFLSEIDIPGGVASIEVETFSGCINLTKVTLHEGLISIGDNAFWDCKKLTEINIPKTVTSIGEETFSGCINLSKVTLHEGLTRIGDSAFNSCTKLEHITIPESVMEIGDFAFLLCNDDFVACVVKGSYAEEYMIENDIKYELINS